MEVSDRREAKVKNNICPGAIIEKIKKTSIPE